MVSDLHIGSDPELDDFASDNEFEDFVARIESNHKGSPTELVLLGDTFDLWQIVPSSDKIAEKATEIDLDLSEEGEGEKLHLAARQHPKVFDALRGFLQGDPKLRRLVIVPGNHDHSLVEAYVQQELRSLLGANIPCVYPALQFSPSYDDTALGIYGEHGNQYDRAKNFYEHFMQFQHKEECAGYFFVRLFWNRLETLESRLDNIYPDRWREIFLWIWRTGQWNLLSPALRYIRQYAMDGRVPKLIYTPRVHSFAAGPQVMILPGMPERLLDPNALEAPYFSIDSTTENEYLRLFHDDWKARQEIVPLLREKFGHVPDLPVPSTAVPSLYGRSFLEEKDTYLTSVEGMFANSPYPQPPSFRSQALDQNIYRYVVLGHTHWDKQESIRTVAKATYFNTGSWISRVDNSGAPLFRRYYLAILQGAEGRIQERFEPFGN